MNVKQIENRKKTAFSSWQLKYFDKKYKKSWKLLFLLLPFIIFVVIFAYAPLFGWSYAFYEYVPGLKLSEMNFVGLKNFKSIFGGGSGFYSVMGNTLAISGLSLICTVIPVIFAIMVSQLKSVKFSKFVQSVTSIPNFISWVLVYAMAFALFSTDSGAINTALLSFGIIKEPIDVLGDVKNAWYIQTLISIWKGTGWGAIIYLAAIAGIDQELYEAAAVDGAHRFQKIIHITLPGIAPTYMVMLLLGIANLLGNGFDQFWVFQNALTREKLEVFDTYIYRLGMINSQYSFSTAMGIFKSGVSIALLLIANRMSKIVRGEAIV